MPTTTSFTQTPSRESRSPPADRERPRLPPPPMTPILHRQLNAIAEPTLTQRQRPRSGAPSPKYPELPSTRQNARDDTDRYYCPASPSSQPWGPNLPIMNTRSSLQSPPPETILPPLSQVLEPNHTITPVQVHPARPPPATPVHPSGRRNYIFEHARLPQHRPPPATPVFEALRAALTVNTNRFVIRLQTRKADLLSNIQPHCPRLSELCEAFCSCKHALNPSSGRLCPSDRRSRDAVSAFNNLNPDSESIHVLRPEHRHAWLFTLNGVTQALRMIKTIMIAEMPLTTLGHIQEAKQILMDIHVALGEELELSEQRTGRKTHSRWEVCWERNEQERKRWVYEGYKEALEKKVVMPTMALTENKSMEGREGTAADSTTGRGRAASFIAHAVRAFSQDVRSGHRASAEDWLTEGVRITKASAALGDATAAQTTAREFIVIDGRTYAANRAAALRIAEQRGRPGYPAIPHWLRERREARAAQAMARAAQAMASAGELTERDARTAMEVPSFGESSSLGIFATSAVTIARHEGS